MHAIQVPEVVAESVVACPNPLCGLAFRCDACLHGHLRARHDASYAEAFGPPDDTTVVFCPAHGDCSPSMLGL